MDAGTTSTTLTARLPILNPVEYDLWLMRIEQYFLMTDYSLWEVILNGNKVLKRTVRETKQEYEPTTAEEKQDRRNEIKARGTLLMALLNKDQLKFYSYKDEKLLMEAIKKRYGGNKESKKEMAILTIRARRFIQRTGMKLDVNECRAPRNQENRGRENSRRTMIVETPTKNALVAQDRIEGYDWSYQAEEEHPTNFTLMAHTSSVSSSNSDSEFKTRLGYNAASSTAASPTIESFVNSFEMLEDKENNKSRSDKGYHVIPPPYTGNFIPFKPDLTFMDEIIKSENIDVITVITSSNVKKVELNHKSTDVKNNGDAVEPKTVRKNSFRPPVIVDWNSDDDSEVEFIPNVKDKTVRPSTKKIKFVKSARETVEKVIRPVWNNSIRVNHKNFANKMTHPHPNRRFVPQAVLTRSGKINTAGVSVNTAVRPVNIVGSKTTGHPQQKEYNEKGVIDSGCSRHMTGNKCYLTEYEDYVVVLFPLEMVKVEFLETGTLDFDNVYFCKELKYNLFSVLQICDKNNNVLFTDNECLVLSSNFKLLDESQVLLRVARKDNIYSVNLKSVVPTKGLTCLFAKATIDESNL
ncbi:hypothetical protein Tco_1003137 [Tanacetum coccineum]|uniref:Retrovirus-related Pol polyprotein from transposon TNT 1-94-like beta-barrel domain-containing protein n=1 Tax=Tanacetum coccineum TaxID=301880 RepID=A0ABQ5F970_9ASTR